MPPLREIVYSLTQKHRFRPKADVKPEEMYENAFRVKVQFKDMEKHFAFDPNLFSFEQLTYILSNAFSISVPFIVSYMRRAECCKVCTDKYSFESSVDDFGSFFNIMSNTDLDPEKISFDSPYYAYDRLCSIDFKPNPAKSCKHYHNSYVHDGDLIPILSDYDLDGAVLNSADIRLLLLHIEAVEEHCEGAFNEDEWDMVEVQGVTDESIFNNNIPKPLTNSLFNSSTSSVEKGASNAFSRKSSLSRKSSKRKMLRSRTESKSDVETSRISFSWWLTLLDSKGRIQDQMEFRGAVFNHSVKSNFRHIAWKHLLGLYPHNTTFDERKAHIERLKADYDYLKSDAFHQKLAPSLKSLIQKDVVRTDRHVAYFNQEFSHPNIQKLYNVLYVYATNNRDVEYAQGMSDLAAAFVCTITDEALAYFCFSKYMEYNKGKFLLNSEVISTCFYQLTRLLKKYDPQLYSYLEKIGSQTLLFCYRWFLLDLKREFNMADSLRFLDTYFACIRQPEPGESHFNRVIKDVEHYTCLMGCSVEVKTQYIKAVRSFYCENVRRTFESYRYSFPVYGCFALLKLHRKNIMKKQLKLDTITIFYEQLIRQQDVDCVLEIAKEHYLLDIEQQLQKLVNTHHYDLLTTSISDINKKSAWKFL